VGEVEIVTVGAGVEEVGRISSVRGSEVDKVLRDVPVAVITGIDVEEIRICGILIGVDVVVLQGEVPGLIIGVDEVGINSKKSDIVATGGQSVNFVVEVDELISLRSVVSNNHILNGGSSIASIIVGINGPSPSGGYSFVEIVIVDVDGVNGIIEPNTIVKIVGAQVERRVRDLNFSSINIDEAISRARSGIVRDESNSGNLGSSGSSLNGNGSQNGASLLASGSLKVNRDGDGNIFSIVARADKDGLSSGGGIDSLLNGSLSGRSTVSNIDGRGGSTSGRYGWGCGCSGSREMGTLTSFTLGSIFTLALSLLSSVDLGEKNREN